MNLDLIRKIVEEEVMKSLSSAKSSVRIRRPVVSEAMIVAARRRGSRSLQIPPGAIVTPAARERAGALGIAIEETMRTRETPESRAVTEAVMAAVVGALSKRPHPAASPASPGMIVKKLVTAADLELWRFNTKVITVGRKTLVTPLARELAGKYGVRIIAE
ncbi:MAG: hypothetical protein AAB229_06185 [Candidatus Hydrogenedentota bacterium]